MVGQGTDDPTDGDEKGKKRRKKMEERQRKPAGTVQKLARGLTETETHD